ncbi:hypothetical protein R2083_04960 [Nitrosomonas sp. Is35]|uniref:hypothetical protein n=1 Tax=unclassified Nitrosomonas TaxID=2609265 RepID=UPI00294B6C88|nr:MULTISPECIES: hypothetical protein [unclassified Nitrosomonas]MDV6341889.1 hypothetical protein [Nitrosomonas sp. Is24]MDV6346866.1 hypothetical protein [Nitrosomonas sp. Is35]
MFKMTEKFKYRTLMLMAALGLSATWQSALAHTRLKTPIVQENAANHGSDYNAVVVAHGCHNPVTGNSDANTIGTVVVFPDGKDSIITVDGQPHGGALTDFVTNWGNPVTKIQDKSIFPEEDYIKDSLGNKLGFWTGGGKGLKGGFRAVVPFTTAGVVIEPASCAKSVTFVLGIVDICEITDASKFNDETVQMWTPAVGSIYDGPGLHGFNSPATLKVNRSIAALPASCGAGVDVVVKPSANQLNRDLRINFDGKQIWPQ